MSRYKRSGRKASTGASTAPRILSPKHGMLETQGQEVCFVEAKMVFDP